MGGGGGGGVGGGGGGLQVLTPLDPKTFSGGFWWC